MRRSRSPPESVVSKRKRPPLEQLYGNRKGLKRTSKAGDLQKENSLLRKKVAALNKRVRDLTNVRMQTQQSGKKGSVRTPKIARTPKVHRRTARSLPSVSKNKTCISTKDLRLSKFKSMLEDKESQILQLQKEIHKMRADRLRLTARYEAAQENMFRWRGRAEVHEGGKLSSLENLLAMGEQARDSFEKYLRKEYSQENLLFWKEIKAYQEKYRDAVDSRPADSMLKTMRVDCMRIYDQFVRGGAECEVNLPSAVYAHIHSVLGLTPSRRSTCTGAGLPTFSLDSTSTDDRSDHDASDAPLKCSAQDLHTVFDRARRESFALMNRDSFQRYQDSHHHTELVRQLTLRSGSSGASSVGSAGGAAA